MFSCTHPSLQRSSFAITTRAIMAESAWRILLLPVFVLRDTLELTVKVGKLIGRLALAPSINLNSIALSKEKVKTIFYWLWRLKR